MTRTLTFSFALVPLLAAALAGCGGGGAGAAAPPPPTPSRSGAFGAFGRGAGPRTVPGAFGVAAAVGKSSLEVQNPQTGQTTVKFTGSTAFRRTGPATLAAVTVGSCVTVTSVGTASGNSLTARSVAITPAVKGSCTTARDGGFGGFGGFGGVGPQRPGGRPSGRPTARPSGTPRFAGRATAAGKVTAVSGGGFTVRGILRAFRFNRSASPRPSGTPAAVTISVTVDGSTSYSRTVATSHAKLKVGQCIAAIGKADGTGAVTAASITISAPVNGTCFQGGQGQRPSSGGTNA